MALIPSRTKYRKQQKGRVKGKAQRGNSLAFGDFGMQSLERTSITSSQIEAARVAVTRHLKRKGKVWIRIFPHKPITKKPLETRMGKGKGSVERWVAPVKPGTMLFEVGGVPSSLARSGLRLADTKLPCRCRFVSREVE